MYVRILFNDNTVYSTYARSITFTSKGNVLIIDTCSEDKYFEMESIKLYSIQHFQI